MDFTRCKIWKNDLKILGNALIKSIKGLFPAKIKRAFNTKITFPLFEKRQKEAAEVSTPPSKYVYYGEDASNKNVTLLSYTKYPFY
ncbi:TPA: hypothetical protein ACS7XF_000501 [Providencia alcalifaciens]